jgi:methylmalonyl-CoA mutase
MVLTGTNRFANADERVLDRVDPARSPSVLRAGDAFEQLRLRMERAEKKFKSTRILLAEIGDTKMRGARSQFAADFVACAGFSTETQAFKRAGAIADTNADAIVLCSSDQEYLAIAEELMPMMKERRAQVLIAGHPESREQLRKLGVLDFIHLRSNAIEVLARLQERIGIEV